MKKSLLSLILGLFLLGNFSFAQSLEAVEDYYEDQIDAMNLPDYEEDRLEAQMENALLNGEEFSLGTQQNNINSWEFTLNNYANCKINGVNVPCDEFFWEVGSVLKQVPLFQDFLKNPEKYRTTIIWIIVILFVIGILSFIFWLRMLIDLINYQKDRAAIWAIVLIFFYLLGALIYYFTARRTRLQQQKMNAIES